MTTWTDKQELLHNIMTEVKERFQTAIFHTGLLAVEHTDWNREVSIDDVCKNRKMLWITRIDGTEPIFESETCHGERFQVPHFSLGFNAVCDMSEAEAITTTVTSYFVNQVEACLSSTRHILDPDNKNPKVLQGGKLAFFGGLLGKEWTDEDNVWYLVIKRQLGLAAFYPQA